MQIDLILTEIFLAFLPLSVGFVIGHFYSREKFEKEYREGFKRGYTVGRMVQGNE